MKQKLSDFFERNGFFVLAAICVIALAAVMAIVGTDTKEKKYSVAENAADFNDQASEIESTNSNAKEDLNKIINELSESSTEDIKETEAIKDTNDEIAANAPAAPVFDGSAALVWPVQGDIIMNYSMDTTTYYKTLDQYKCNRGLLISSDVNTPVCCCYSGIVEAIFENEEFGTCIIVNLGNDYKTIYGQLKDIDVTEGEAVTTGQQIACVAAPSKYFTEEGSHLYFEMTKDGIALNPNNYLK